MGLELLNATSASNSAFRVVCGQIKIKDELITHREALFCYLKSGNAVIEISGETISLSEGDIYFVSPNRKYRITGTGVVIDAVSLNFANPASITQDYVPQNMVRSLINGSCTKFARISPDDECYENMLSDFKTVVNAETVKDDYFQLIVWSKMYELFYILFYNGYVKISDAGKKSKKYHALLKVTEYIDDNYSNGISLEDVAVATGISRYYVSHLFNELTDTTFINYVNELRLSRASTLLVTTDYAINDIASMSGFNNLSNFNRVFKLKYNKTPSDYRRSV